jgi:hypothetical protein
MEVSKREATMRPYTRKPSSANHSMMSAAARVSPFARRQLTLFLRQQRRDVARALAQAQRRGA